ncbi:MAG TPA: GGDEF domain-containing protein [Armatimonadota bacterium]|nr:GGDEF domain-containing protein [Armatimonadota bacterium]
MAMPGVFNRIAQRVSRVPLSPALPRQEQASEEGTRAAAALALAREVLHAVEQFVISTPDLDTRRFLQRMRGTAAGLTSAADPATLCLYKEWAGQALGAFAELQRRYVSDREDEMWRLLDSYVQVSNMGIASDTDVAERLEASLGRMKDYVRLDDIRRAREGLEEELALSQKLVDQKEREDKERLAALQRQVSRLEAALAAVRGQAKYDVLTGIYHRGSFQDRFVEMMESGTPCCVALIDVDNFKTINDTLGHPVGDRLLALIGEQLRKVTRSTDVSARFGGDEFCFLTPGNNCEMMAQRLAGAVQRRHARLEMEDRVISVLLSLSVGIAATRQGDDPDSLLQRADQALLAAKKDGKGGIRLAPAA